VSSRSFLSRIGRIVRLIGLLQGGRGYNAQALADVCRVSKRTIFRDLDALREAEVPLVYDPEREQYQIPGHYFLPPTSFTAEEALAVITLCRQLGGAEALPFLSPARSAAVKLENALPDRLLRYLRSVSERLSIKLDATNRLPGREEVYESLLAAMANQRCVRIEYDSPTEKSRIQTRLHPYRLLFNQHSWYVIGRSTLHREVRTFHLGRITRIMVLEDPLSVPKRFTVEGYLRNAWRLIPEPGADSEVVVRFSPQVARNVAEVHWHRTQRTSWQSDGSLEFRVTVSGLREISWWILGYGDQAEVLEPTELRQRIAERARNLLALYEQGRTSQPSRNDLKE
jgi:predicted DNA-binding transcriptional regulator YafY